jgi:DNA-binding NarL/FixJ family response regulator
MQAVNEPGGKLPRHKRHVRRALPLSTRELQVLECLADGMCNAEIAWQLSVSVTTANKHVSAVIGKMQARSRTDAVARAFRSGLVF